MIKILKLNDQDVNLSATDGGVVNINYNETLDSAVIRVPHLPNKLDIKPFYNCLLQYGNNNLRYMCVDSYTCTMDNLDVGQITYTYEIHLFSEVKKLERVILPNLSITPRKIGDKLKVRDYLKQYLDEYSPKHIVNTGLNFKLETKRVEILITTEESDVNCYGFKSITIPLLQNQTISAYSISGTPSVSIGSIINTSINSVSNTIDVEAFTTDEAEVKIEVIYIIRTETLDQTHQLENDYELHGSYLNKFNIDCPEMQWTNPTLRDVLNDLMMVNDCIVTMENNVIKWLDLTEKHDPITDYNYITETMSSEDYETDIRMQMQNVMQTSLNGINNVVRTVERIPFMSSAYIGTSENTYLETQYPIMNIKKLYLVIYPTIETYNVEPYKFDITGFVKEKQEYDTLPIRHRIESISSLNLVEDLDYFKSIQNTCLFFNRLGTQIQGFSRLSKSKNIIDADHTTLQYLKAFAFIDYCRSKGYTLYNIETFVIGTMQYFSTSFEIEYETTASCVFEAGKKNAKGFKSVINDNQTNAWADAYNTGRLEYQKANRLGNRNWMVNQRVEPNTNLIKIGDYLEDFIVYQVQYQQYIDHEEVNASMVENYILQNYFTGIKSRVRTWVNAKNEAFEKHELVKYYLEFSKTQKNEFLDYDINEISNYFLSPISQVGDSIKYSAITSSETENYYNVGCLTRLVGNSIVLTTGFNDNGFAGKYVDYKTIEENRNGLKVFEEGSNSTTGSTKTIIPPSLNSTVITSVRLGGIPYNIYSYTDENFESTSFDILFSSEMEYEQSSDAREIFKESYERPKVNISKMTGNKLQVHLDRHKDNKEIPLFSVQYEFCTDTNDIDFYPEFLKYQRAISSLSGVCEIYDLQMNKIANAPVLHQSENSSYFDLPVSNGYICVDGKPIIKFTNTNRIWLNVRRTRNENAN